MTWGRKPDQKQHVNSVAGQVAYSKDELLKKQQIPPEVKIFASTKVYVSAVLMLVCGLFIIIASGAFFLLSYKLPYHALHYVHMCRIFGVCAGVLFSIAGFFALLANSKQNKTRLFFATVLCLLAAIVALLIIIGISFFVLYGVKHHREMSRGNDDPKMFGRSPFKPYPERHKNGDDSIGKVGPYYYPTPTPAGWDQSTRRPWHRPHRPTPPPNYINPWDRPTRRPWWPTRRPWSDWTTRRPWSDWTTRRPWSHWTTRRPWSDWRTRRPWYWNNNPTEYPGEWTTDHPKPQSTPPGHPEPSTEYPSEWAVSGRPWPRPTPTGHRTSKRPSYWGTTNKPWPQPKPSRRPEETGYPWNDWTTRSPWYYWTTRRPWYDWTTRRPWYDWTTRRPSYDWTTRRPSYDWTTRRPSYDLSTRRPWYDWTTRRPSYDWTTRRPWYDWTTRRPWYDWTTRRPWYDWTTRRPWYDWTTRRPWYDWTTRRSWYDWTTRRPWYDWTTRQPWQEQPTPAGWGQHEGGRGMKGMLIFMGGIAVVIMVLTELVNAVILTIFGFRSLRPHKYSRLRVAVNVPSDEKKILADVDDLPVV